MSLIYALLLGAGFGSLFTLVYLNRVKQDSDAFKKGFNLKKEVDAERKLQSISPAVTSVPTATCECGQVKYLKKIGLNKRESWVHYANQFVCKWTTRLPLEG